jgi:hypothetical protein
MRSPMVGGIRANQRTESSTRGIWAIFLGVLTLVMILIFSVMMEFYVAKKREMTLIYESNPLRRQHLLPNQQYKRGDVVIHINQLGLRDNPPQRPKPPRSCRIAVMGGSSVFDIRAGHQASWPSRLSKELARQGLGGVESINAGVPGYTSRESIAFYHDNIRFLKPDVVLLYEGWNDAKYIRVRKR